MTLIQLEYFRTLAHVLHYTRAAEELHIAQPSLSYSIRALENELGAPLFEKQGRSVRLTPYGDQFLLYAEKALQYVGDGILAVAEMKKSVPQVVRLGYFHSVSATLVPDLVNRIRSEENDATRTRFHFSEAPSYDLLKELKAGELDLAFCLHLDDTVESMPVLRQPLYLVVRQDHPLASRDSVRFEDFAEEPQIMLTKTSRLHAQMDRIYRERGRIPTIVFEVRECNAALQHVMLGSGVSVLPRVPMADNNPRLVLLPIIDEPGRFTRTVYLSWKKDRPLGPAAQHVRDAALAAGASVRS